MSAIVITGGGDIAYAIKDELARIYPKRIVYMLPRRILDVTDQNAVCEIFDFFKPHILINCAGYISPGDIKTSAPEEWREELNVNLYGPYLLSKYAVKNGAHTIIHIGSTAGTGGRAKWSGYAASKAGLVNFVESLAAEGYKAYCLSPGRTDTKMRNKLYPKEDKASLLKPSDVAALIPRIFKGEFTPGDNIVVTKTNKGVETNVW